MSGQLRLIRGTLRGCSHVLHSFDLGGNQDCGAHNHDRRIPGCVLQAPCSTGRYCRTVSTCPSYLSVSCALCVCKAGKPRSPQLWNTRPCCCMHYSALSEGPLTGNILGLLFCSWWASFLYLLFFPTSLSLSPFLSPSLISLPSHLFSPPLLSPTTSGHVLRTSDDKKLQTKSEHMTVLPRAGTSQGWPRSCVHRWPNYTSVCIFLAQPLQFPSFTL